MFGLPDTRCRQIERDGLFRLFSPGTRFNQWNQWSQWFPILFDWKSHASIHQDSHIAKNRARVEGKYKITDITYFTELTSPSTQH